MDEQQLENALSERFGDETEVAAEPQAPAEPEVTPVETPSTIKIGDEEFTVEEAQALIGLGKIGKEAEEKFGTKIDRVWPEFTKKSQRLAELEKAQAQVATTKAEAGQPLSVDEAKLALKQIGGVTAEDIPQFIANYLEGIELRKTTEGIASEASQKGIKTTAEEILTFMETEGVKRPDVAFELMYRDQLKKWEQSQIEKVKPEPVLTQGQSTAGAKQPETVRPTKDNLKDLLESYLKD